MPGIVNVNIVIDTPQGVKITKSFATADAAELEKAVLELQAVCKATLDFATAVEEYSATLVQGKNASSG